MPTSRTGPLSAFQAGYWHRDQRDPGTFATIFRAFDVTGPFDLSAWEAGLSALIHRHDALRVRFEVCGERPVQVVEPELSTPLTVVDLRDRPAELRAAECERRIEAELAAPFDLARGPLLRATVLRKGDEDHVLLLAVHHIVCDGWSLDLLLSELTEHYRAGTRGDPPATTAAATTAAATASAAPSYLELLGWQRSELTQRREAARGHWQKVCQPPPSSFIRAYLGPVDVDSYENARQRFQFDADLAGRLTQACRSLRTTPYLALLAGLKAALWSLSGQEDLSVGSLFAGRTRPETEAAVGLFANVTLLRTSLAGAPTYRRLVGRVREAVLDAAEHQTVPVDAVVPGEVLRPAWDVWFNVLPAPPDGLRLAGAQVHSRFPEPAPRYVKTTPVWDAGYLSVTVWPAGGAWNGFVDYNRRVLTPAAVDRVITTFLSVTARGLSDPDRPVTEIGTPG